MSRQHKHPAEVCDHGCKVKPVIPVGSLFPVTLSRSGAGAAETQSSAQEKWAGGGEGVGPACGRAELGREGNEDITVVGSRGSTD